MKNKEVDTTLLFRPIGQLELDMIKGSDYKRFPPRLFHQPFFYPVLNREYAEKIARDWNTKDLASGFVGYVTSFRVKTSYLLGYEVHTAGAKVIHQEYWIPAEDLEKFNQNIVGLIEVLAEFRGESAVETAPNEASDSVLYAFASNYQQSDWERIKFNWNGMHGQQLEDPNSDFRLRLCDFIIRDFGVAGDQLIRDLYLELSKASRETWAVYRDYHLFAQELLDRGGTKYFLDYMRGSMHSFDTFLASGRVIISDDLRSELNDFIDESLAATADSDTRLLLESAKERFCVKQS